MRLYPAIDIKDGQCVRLKKGLFNEVTVYSDKPYEIAKAFEESGAQFIHTVDLDGALKGHGVNADTIKKIVSSVNIPVQMGGGIRTLENIKEVLALGVYRVIIGTKAVENPDFIRQAIEPNLKLDPGGKQIIKGALGVSGTATLYKDIKDYFFLIGVILVLVVLFIIQNLVNSRSGRAITSTRDNRIAAESIGINVTKNKLLAFTISAAIAGVAGVLYAHNLSMLKVSIFDYNMSITILVYVILGGMGNLRGSILATIVLYALPELLRGFSTYRMLIYAIVMITMMLFNWAPAARDFRSRIIEKIKGHVKEKEAA